MRQAELPLLQAVGAVFGGEVGSLGEAQEGVRRLPKLVLGAKTLGFKIERR